ncbi:MAG: PTS sugar transporter subunit IIA, partial [Sphingomonadales bacterium]|nr:PTS sugar transporter subunit IIA [Sphingomonadales bacterium]
MEISDLVSPDAVLARLKATSKKQALNELSALAAAQTGLSEREIFDVLLERERLGTTGV